MSVHVERPLLCTCSPLSHVHSPIGTKRHFSVVNISLQLTRYPPRARIVDDLAAGVNFRPWWQLDSPLQRGRATALGIGSAASPFDTPCISEGMVPDKKAEGGADRLALAMRRVYEERVSPARLGFEREHRGQKRHPHQCIERTGQTRAIETPEEGQTNRVVESSQRGHSREMSYSSRGS